MAITDAARFGDEQTLAMAERVSRLGREGSVIVQLRDRERPPRERLALGRRLRQITRAHGQWLSVGERLDLALLLDADAVHLPEAAPDAERVRELLRERRRPLWLSRAVHRVDGPPAGCDAWVVAPVSEGRKGRPALGFSALEAFVRAAGDGTRVFALGGVGPVEATRVVGLGAGVAAIGAAYSETERLVDALGIRRPAAAV
jgi:thiamine-phosphate pyrophosphorylase